MKFLFACLILISATGHCFEMAISSAQIAPIATILYTKDGAKIRKTGTLYLLGQYIEKHIQEPVTYRVIKRGKASQLLASNQIQSLCYMTPQWLSINSDQVTFSKPFMRNSEKLISRKPISLIKEKRDLQGVTLGIIKGYHYPAIQDLIDSDYVQVEFHQSEQSNFIALFQQDTLDAVIFKEVAFKHFSETLPHIVGRSSVVIHPLSLGEVEVSCALSSASKHYLPKINAAIDAFIQDYPL